MARYLVTGGAGFIGSNIAEELVRRGEDVVVLDNLSTGHEANLGAFRDRITFVKGDIRDAGAVRSALAGVDCVLHQAALASVPRSIADPVLVNEVNIGGTLTVLEESRKAGVKRLVYAASSSAYGDTEELPKIETMAPQPRSPYAITKLTGEYYCSVYSSVYGLPTVSLRYFNVFGPRQDPKSQYAAVIPLFITALLAKKRPTIFGDGEQSRDFTFIANVVAANIRAAHCSEARGQVVNVACGTRYTLNELFRRIRAFTGTAIDPEYADPRPGDVKHSQADIAAARRLIGYEVLVPFEEGLGITVDWYRRRG